MYSIIQRAQERAKGISSCKLASGCTNSSQLVKWTPITPSTRGQTKLHQVECWCWCWCPCVNHNHKNQRKFPEVRNSLSVWFSASRQSIRLAHRQNLSWFDATWTQIDVIIYGSREKVKNTPATKMFNRRYANQIRAKSEIKLGWISYTLTP